MIQICVDRHYRVNCRLELAVPISHSACWGQMRDVASFATMDPFHARVHLRTPAPQTGCRLVIEHRLGWLRLDRMGRILWYRERRGYAFSDLSGRGPTKGFPHVYVYEVRSVAPGESSLRVTVRGRWTARWLPRWAVRIWLRWVMAQIGTRIEHAMLMYRLAVSTRSASLQGLEA